MTTPGEAAARGAPKAWSQPKASGDQGQHHAIGDLPNRERDRISPSVGTLRELLWLLGEDLTLGAAARDSRIDRTLIRERFRLTPSERLDYGLAFSDFVIRNSPNAPHDEKAA